MKKIEIQEEIEYYLGVESNFTDESVEIDISKLEADIKAMKNLGVTKLRLDIWRDYDGVAEIYIQPIKVRLETDKEFEKRVLELERQQEIRKEREIKELERLQNKYNKLK